MQIRNNHNWKLETLGLMNRHQANDIGGFVHLAFAFAAADRFEFFDVMNEVAD